MELSKKGKSQVSMPGSLNVSGDLSSKNIKVSENAVIEGDLVVNGKISGNISIEKSNDTFINLGQPDTEGSWRLRVDNDGYLNIEKFEEGEWTLKQSIM